MITLDGVIQAVGSLRKKHQAVSNMAVGAHHIATKLLVRTCKNLRNLQIIFWVEKPLRFLLPTGLKMQKCGLASTMGLADVKKLKSQKLSGSEGSDIQGWGRGKVIQLLLKNDLVDNFDSKFIL